MDSISIPQEKSDETTTSKSPTRMKKQSTLPGDSSGTLKKSMRLKDHNDSSSRSNTLKRKKKLKDQSDNSSSGGTLKRGLRKHTMRSNDSTSIVSSDSLSSRNSMGFGSKSPHKAKKNNDDTISIKTLRKPRQHKNYRGSTLKLNDVIANKTAHDETVSMVGSLFGDSITIREEEGIRDVIGRKDVVTLKKMVKLERPQGDKTDPKVMILTPYRCQILNVKSPFKLEHDFHFLDIKSLDSPSPDRLVIAINSGKVFFLLMVGADDADHIIGKIALSLRTVFSHVSLSRILKASLEPVERQKLIQTMLNQADQFEPGPCGNFTEMYRCLCDYLNMHPREDVEWDVDTIYLSQNCQEMNMRDFNINDPKEMNPILSVLMYNSWFNTLIVKDMKLNNEVVEFIIKVVRNCHNLVNLTLSNLALKCDFAQRLATNLIENKESRLESLDLSQNLVEDQGMIQISGALTLIKHGSLKRLNFAYCELTPTGINGLCQSLRSSATAIENLTHLNLSGNCIKGNETEELFTFLSTENHLIDLDLTSTDCAVEVCISALSKGCTKHLQNLRIGKNRFFGRKGKDWALPRAFQEFFKNASSLKLVDFSDIKYPPEALGSMLDGLLGNCTRGLKIELSLASCELRSPGCLILQRLLPSIQNISDLDISDNGFDYDINDLFSSLQYNRSLKSLKIGRNFSSIKPRHLKETMEAMVEMVQEEGSRLESFSIADSKVRDYINTFLSCLGSNTSLTSLDISGNGMGDGGARVLAKSLQTNSKLRNLLVDRNNLTANGFTEIANALEKNYTLRHIPYPVNDAVTAIKYHLEKTQSALTRIQNLLLRNTQENRGSNEQQFRLQKAMSVSAQQVLDRMAEKVRDAINTLEQLDPESVSSDVVLTAQNLVKDAVNSKQLLSDIYGLAMEKAVDVDSVLQRKLRRTGEEMEKMVQQHIKDSVAAMVQNAEAQCSHMFENIKTDLESSTERECELPRGQIADHVMKTSGSEVVNRVSETNLMIATTISNQVNDSLLASLSQSNILLEEEITKCKDKNKDEADLRSESSEQLSEELEKVTTADNDTDRDSTTDMLLPSLRKERKNSLAKRRQRPDSTSVSTDETDLKSPKLEVESSSDRGETLLDFSADEHDKQEEAGDVKADEVDVDKKEESPQIDQDSSLEASEQAVTPEEKTAELPPKQAAEEKTPPTEEKMVTDPKQDQTIDATTGDVTKLDGEFPEADEASKLSHVTKARPRAPGRRQRRPPKRPTTTTTEDDFFQTNVSNLDFSQIPTLEEEEEIKRKERIQEKMASRKMPGMGMPLFAPGSIKLKKKEESTEEVTSQEQEKPEESPSKKPSIKRPVGGMGMGMPGMGMGFGGNMLAEMKLKKLNKTSQEKIETKNPDPSESESNQRTSPFGRSVLRKRSEGSELKSPGPLSPSDKDADTKKSESAFGPSLLKKRVKEPDTEVENPNSNNNNNNNNNLNLNPFRFLSKSSEKTNKPSPPLKKPSLSKSPPVPTKPKVVLKPSSPETSDPSPEESKTAGLSSIRDRIASLKHISGK